MNETTHHIGFMETALREAKNAQDQGEVPVGAVLVDATGAIISTAHNQTISLADPTAHAEILALRNAAQKVSNYRLLNTTLYVTVEPCVMCMGAIINARVAQVVFGAPDPKWGALGSLYNFATDPRFNHHPEILAGICEKRCKKIMQDFFRARRNR